MKAWVGDDGHKHSSVKDFLKLLSEAALCETEDRAWVATDFYEVAIPNRHFLSRLRLVPTASGAKCSDHNDCSDWMLAAECALSQAPNEVTVPPINGPVEVGQ